MANNVLAINAVAEALKSYYLPGLRYQLNDKASVFLSQLEKDKENVVGKDIVMALRYGRVGGIGNRSDDGDLPTPNSRKTKQAKWETKNLFSRFQISDKTMKASRSNVGAFASMLETEIKDCETDAKLDLSRQALGDGTGKLATISAVSSNTLTVDNTMFFCEGMLVDIYTGDTKDTTAAEVTDVDDANSKITVSSATGAAQNDVIYLSGNKGLELTGLRGVFENSTLYGIDRTTYKWLNATRKNVNGEISDITIQTAIDEADRKAGSNINFILCSLGVRRAYQNVLTATKQLVNTLELKGGWKAISYNGIPLTADKYVGSGKMYCLDLSDWKMYQMSDYEWLAEDGAMLSRVSGKAAWEATLVKYADLGCGKPRGQSELYGIVEHS
jgi:hypothetical protein